MDLSPFKTKSIWIRLIYLHYGDQVNGIYFCIKGRAAFVIPGFDFVSYINVGCGDCFGKLDFIASSERKNFVLEEWFNYQSFLQW